MGFLFSYFWTVCLILSSPAHATDLELQAEHRRLGVEMERLAQRQAWKGVDRYYRSLLDLELRPSFLELTLAAEAAWELGDIELCYQRLREADAIQNIKDIEGWIGGIDNSYGYVELSTTRVQLAELNKHMDLIDPVAQRAYDKASATLQERGDFSGRLPAGSYTFAGQDFTVEPGTRKQVSVSHRQWKASRQDHRAREVPLEEDSFEKTHELVIYTQDVPVFLPEAQLASDEEEVSRDASGFAQAQAED